MSALIIDGKKLSTELANKLREQVLTLVNKKHIQPKLVIIQVGDHAESNTYVQNKKLFGEKIGVIVECVRFVASVAQDEIISFIKKHNVDAAVHGIIVQLPLPAGFDAAEILESIDPTKDVDGMTSKSVKQLFEGRPGFIPATTKGIVALLESVAVFVSGKKVVIVGHSVLVGKPTALALLNMGATVTVCHSQTKDLPAETRQADIVIVAVGQPGLIGRDHVAPGQVVIDIGITVTEVAGIDGQLSKKKIRGDVDFESVKEIVGMITPVPGGVGPMTIVSLFENVLQAASR